MTPKRLSTVIDQISLSDTTQREGRQSEGVHLSPEASVEHARLVDRLGIDYLELNHPASSPTLNKLVKEISNLGLKKTKVVTHVRCNFRDVQTAIETGVQGINTYIPIKPHSEEAVQSAIKQAIEEDLPKIVELTRKNEVELRVSVEHALSLPLKLLTHVYREVSCLDGVHRVGIAETTGVCWPWKLREYAEAIYQVIPEKTPIQFHMHNDHGLVAANFLEILGLLAKNGRKAVFDISIAGYGERNGILSYGDVFSILYLLNSKKLKARYNIDKYGDLVRFVEKEIGVPLCRRDPLNPWAFSHSAAPHLDGMINDSNPYQAISPEDFGFELKLNVGHCVTGHEGIKYFAQREMGFEIPDEAAKEKVINLLEALEDQAEVDEVFTNGEL